jgi:hypothetical protein
MISFPAIERLQSVDSIGCFTWSASVSTISLAIPRSTAAWTPCKHATPLRPRRRPDSRIWCRAPPSCWDYFSVAVSYDVAQPPSPVSFRQAEASQLIFRVPSSGRCHFWEVQILTLGSFPSYCAKLPPPTPTLHCRSQLLIVSSPSECTFLAQLPPDERIP